ncbi:hypothetical protein [Rothia dentocariosa]|uniref:hypothetical protein n=1 Tax=Rothia dentocariosa TaxID=2047 RepID=UPI00241FBC7A|nr:hypothetical protein [Rothia dentocariosa]
MTLLWYGEQQEVKKSEESKKQIKPRDDREILHKCQEERARTTRLIHMGTPEFRIEKGKPEKKSITSTRKDFGDKGSIILELKRQYSKKENEWITQGKIRFIYPEKGIDESLHEGTYWLPLEAKLKLRLTTEKQTFTYTDDPDEEGSNLFYFRNDCPIDHQNGLYIRINKPVTQKGE